MEHFTSSINDGVENDENFLSHDPGNKLDPKQMSNDVDEIDIEALLNRPRCYGYRRTKAFEEAPEFVQRLEAFIEVEAGNSVFFECKWKAFPSPTIKWYRDDEEITSDHPYFRAHEDKNKGIARLDLPEVTGQDEGAFKCKAENQEGVASTTGYLSVTGDISNKTLSAQQKKSNSPTSPCVSTAPHLMTILEQKSLEEREAEMQRKLPPSPLQDYIEIVQKTKTWPLAKMGYNPEDFIPKKTVENEDAESSGSDTSVDSQPDTPVIQLPQGNSDTLPNGVCDHGPTDLNLLHPEDVNDNDSVHSFDSTEMDDDVDENHKPVCTVTVQIRSCDSVSRLTRIRQTESKRLSLTFSEETENSDFSDNVSENESLDETTPLVKNEDIEKNLKEQDTICESDEAISPEVSQIVGSCINMDSSIKSKDSIIPQQNSTEMIDTVKPLDESHKTKLSKIPSNSSKKSLAHQSSREKKTRFKKQRSLVEMSIEWLFQKITGKVGEQLDLPWVYYFAFTVMCGCFAAAIRLNPFYMIITIAVLSFVSFRFLACEQVDSDLELEYIDQVNEQQTEL